MNSIYQYIFENVKADKLDKYVGAGIINLLGQEVSHKGKDIAIIGVSIKFPMANNTKEYWDVLKNGVDCIDEFPTLRKSIIEKHREYLFGRDVEFKYNDGAYVDEIDKFDCIFFKISPKEANLMDPNQRLFLQTAWNTFEDAGYSGKSIADKRIGVYVGYSSDFHAEYKRMIEAINPSARGLSIPGNIKSIIGSRISYILDLKGPSMMIDTACSSALVSVHIACRAIRDGECEMAIAGATKVILMPLKDDRQNGLGIESSDGRARTFDDGSDGTGIGEGVAAVLLKPLDKALEDRDNIYAVIKGTAVNQDGNSIGITAPNSLAQEEVITSAWNDAGIDPETITYMEAHGTGTHLGDPIEIDGMEGAFRRFTDKKQFCSVGSVKTNIGHLDNAAGMAGLIKAVLALKNRKIPPSLHFIRPNRKISFEESPVYVNDRLNEWETNEFPRRCGVSSFGLSGTNCHIILEEAPLCDNQDTRLSENNDMYIFTMSAKSREVLIELVKKYEELLKNNIDEKLSDICYTQNTGRDHYNCRLAILAKNIETLKEEIGRLCACGLQSIPEKGIYFGEYRLVADYKDTKDEGEYEEKDIKKMSNEANLKLKEITVRGRSEEILKQICRLYINGANIEWEKIYDGLNTKKISLPGYPFVRRQCWVQPESFVEGAEGVKKSISHPLLDDCLVKSMNIVIYVTKFSVNRHWVLKEHTVAGNYVPPGTTYLEMVRELCERHYPDKTMEMEDVIFTSPMVVGEFEDREAHTILEIDGKSIEFNIASKDGISGAWIKHVEGKVTFSDAKPKSGINIDAIKKQCREIEISQTRSGGTGAIITGPRWNNIKNVYFGQNEALAFLELPEDYHSDLNEYVIHPSLMDCSVNIAINSIGEGLYLPFSYKHLKIYDKMPIKIFSHVKKKERTVESDEVGTFDITLADVNGKVFADIEGYSIKKVHEFQTAHEIPVYYFIGWKRKDIEYYKGEYKNRVTLIFKDEKGVADKIIKELKHNGTQIIEIEFGKKFERKDDNNYVISGSCEDYEMIISEAVDRGLSQIIHLSSMMNNDEIADVGELEMNQRKGLYSLFFLTKAIINEKLNKEIDIVLVSEYVNEVTGREFKINPEAATLFGLGKVVRQESINLKCRCIDIDESVKTDDIINEIDSKRNHYQVAYRNGQRYIEELMEVSTDDYDSNEINIKNNGIYVITGGTGGIGLEIAKYLASVSPVKLALINRTEIPERSVWENNIKNDKNFKLVNKLKAILEIESTGSVVECYSADISNMDKMNEIFNELRKKHNRINGVIHSAGVNGYGFIAGKTEEDINEVLKSKVQGTWVLDQLTRSDDMDFFVMFSSIASVFGFPGQGDYAAANSYLDSYAAYRSKTGKKTVTVNWPAWRETGMAFERGTNVDGAFKAISTEKAISSFVEILNRGIKRILIGELNYNNEVIHMRNKLSFVLSEEIEKRADEAKKDLHYSLDNKVVQSDVIIKGKNEEEKYTETETLLAQIWATLLGLEEISIFDNFFELGGNSLISVRLEVEMEKHGIQMEYSDLDKFQTLKELAQYLESKE